MILPLSQGASVSKNWRTINALAIGFNGLRNPNASRDQAISALSKRITDVDFVPFRIYPGDTWLEVKCTTGWVVTPDALFEPTNVDTALSLTADELLNWIYLDVTASAANFVSSPTPPDWSINKIPVGWVDTTDIGNESADIFQLMKDHLILLCPP